MSPEREKLIRDKWREVRGEWTDSMRELRVVVRPTVPPPLSCEEAAKPVPRDVEGQILTYKLGRAWFNGRDGYLIACEGVVVEEWIS